MVAAKATLSRASRVEAARSEIIMLGRHVLVQGTLIRPTAFSAALNALQGTFSLGAAMAALCRTRYLASSARNAHLVSSSLDRAPREAQVILLDVYLVKSLARSDSTFRARAQPQATWYARHVHVRAALLDPIFSAPALDPAQ